MSDGLIHIRGDRQHNLKNPDLDIRTGELTVVTGPSGSGKSSLVFDTLRAPGASERSPTPRSVRIGRPGAGPAGDAAATPAGRCCEIGRAHV